MAQVIGVVKLAPGEVGFYDEMSKIHLTMSRPSADVYDYMNTTKLIRAVRSKVLILVAGSLNAARITNGTQTYARAKAAVNPIVEAVEIIEDQPTVTVVEEEIKEIEPLIEEATEIIAEEVITEEATTEEVIEEVVEVEQPKKKSTKKKK